MSAIPPRRTAARRPHLLILAVEHVLEANRIHEHAAPVKGGEPRGLLRRHGRHLLEEAVNGPPHQLADRAVLLPGNGAKPLHHGIWDQDLNLLYAYIL